MAQIFGQMLLAMVTLGGHIRGFMEASTIHLANGIGGHWIWPMGQGIEPSALSGKDLSVFH